MAAQKNLEDIKLAFGALCETIAALRDPKSGCPWDLEQTHASLRKYMIEEAYEATDVMEPVNYKKLQEELGDVLLQVVLNAQLAKDAKEFSILEVVKDLDSKMRRRHPHVFGEDGNPSSKTSREKSDIKAKWDEVKAQEKQKAPETSGAKGVFEPLSAGKITPASRLAVEIGKLAKKINFDWKDPLEVFSQLESEVLELKEEITKKSCKEQIAAEMGDVIFCVSQLCRHLDLDPEVCALDGNTKFLRRFKSLESLALAKGLDVKTVGTEQLEALWKEAKALEKQNKKS
jgi:MazG family protein